MSYSKSKRPDIQSLRCLAVLAVIAFHLRPDLFPFGYLGVDIFFVLSGYLMSMMMSRVSVINAKSVLDFYWRRISRILPMYSVVICAVAILSRFILAPIDYTTLIRDTRWSLVFGANLQQYIDGSDYWAQVNDSPILLHMWSLGAEVQYYLIVPLIVMLQRCFRRRDHQLVFLGSLAIASFISFALFTMSNEAGAFLLMPNRAWQFIIGSIAFEIDSDEEEVAFVDLDDLNLIPSKREPVSSSRIISILTIVLSFTCLSPLPVPIRLPVSIFTGLLLCYGSLKAVALLSNKFIVKLGNASYVLYLVHWPVITLYKYLLDVKSLGISGALTCFSISVVISLILHEFIELQMLGASKKIIVFVVVALYAATLVLTSIELSDDVRTATDGPYNFTEAIDWNTHKTGRVRGGGCKYDGGDLKWAAPYNEAIDDRCFVHGNGSARILIIGNSFANLIIDHLYPMLQPIAKEIRLFAREGCRTLQNGSFPAYADAWPRVVEGMKPDVTWIISRDLELVITPLVRPIENDPTLRFVKNRLDLISKHSKLVVLDYQSVGMFLHHSIHPPRTLLRQISKKNYDFSHLKVAEKDWIQFHRNETARMDNIDNPKLIRHKISEHQCKEGICYFYNPDNLHSYYADNYGHPTSELMAMMAPSYRGIIKQLKKRLKL